jgi:purine-binding chemotaxis protein CheW
MSTREYVTFYIGGQQFGASVTEIQDVFSPANMTRVPRSRREIAGILNLRGRIVTAIDARARLGLPPRAPGDPAPLAIGFEKDGEHFGLIIDKIGEVLRVEEHAREENPVNLDPLWRGVSRGVYRLEKNLLIIMDIDRMLASAASDQAA